MNVTLNGHSHSLDEPLTVADLLRQLDLEPVRVAVEVNEDLVPRKRFGEAPIRDGDRIEIVTLVGGG
ncbi:MAG: sulfur carrier protein ThiS [Phycisphaerae bacterium]|nr:sulfur carrier protein ThiS [Phycisphaerae bacterium]